jgi:outer membrane lipoprotein SlyB
MSESKSKINPLIATAAIAVTLFSAVGIGVMTGVIPSSRSSPEALSQADTKAAPAPVPAPEAKASAPAVHKRSPAAETRRPARVAANEPAPQPAPVVSRICAECGVIDTINVVDRKGSGSGVGAVGGAVVGGLLGNQVGSGRGNTAATVVGAVGGAVVGNEVEKHVKSTKEYHISVRMDDGSTRNFTFDAAPAYAVGEKVKVIDGKLVKG